MECCLHWYVNGVIETEKLCGVWCLMCCCSDICGVCMWWCSLYYLLWWYAPPLLSKASSFWQQHLNPSSSIPSLSTHLLWSIKQRKIAKKNIHINEIPLFPFLPHWLIQERKKKRKKWEKLRISAELSRPRSAWNRPYHRWTLFLHSTVFRGVENLFGGFSTGRKCCSYSVCLCVLCVCVDLMDKVDGIILSALRALGW